MMGAWDSWLGREAVEHDRIDNAAYGRWLAMLDRTDPKDGPVAQGFHWCLCLPNAPTGALGHDGHPKRDEAPDSFLPPIPQPRRMWASSKVDFLAPLQRNAAISRRSRIASITEKQGGSGKLVFVEVAHETLGDDVPCVREVQSIVYRDPAPSNFRPAPPPNPGEGRFDPTQWDAHRLLEPSESLLFRYSALTFNSHRIHYDLPYATQEEGYRGLVVQGPLTATLLLDLARRAMGDNKLTSFGFRGVSPAICGESLHLVLRTIDNGIELGAYSKDGRHVMSANAVV
ncbi:FAS1-like dehydratase domain-containing protein [Sphingomonas bisphenolicum]